MYKRIALLIIVVFFMISVSAVNAGDIPESLMDGDQKGLFIGELISTNAEESVVLPLTVMMGDIPLEEISVDGIQKYYGTDDVPTQGDYIVVVLLTDNDIDDSWLFKATSSDYKSLELVSEDYNMVKRYQEYINSGAYFEAGKLLDASEEKLDSDALKRNENNNVYFYVEVIGIGLLLIAILGVVIKRKKKNL